MIAEQTRAFPQLYEETIKPLAAVDRIALAHLILADLPPSVVDKSECWTEDDLREWSHAGRQYVEAVLGDSWDA